VISTSHSVAKSIRVPPDVPHLDYCFTPMRYVWDQVDAYLGRGLKRRLAMPAVRALRRFDARTSGPESVTRFVAISTEVADRIRRHYGRHAHVVAPPVDVDWIDVAREPAGDFYLHVAGFVPYKRDALVIEAFRRSRRRLVVVGDGPGRAALQRAAPAEVEFLGRVDDPTLARLYREARALVYPQHEDFGLVAVEAQAAGRPVIAFAAGGALDTVRPIADDGSIDERADRTGGDIAGPLATRQATGVYFHHPTVDSLVNAIERFEKLEGCFDPAALRRWAERFSPARFDEAFDREIEAVLERRP
jgi:glycosyltransferase involved in cell wall biosynthesis